MVLVEDRWQHLAVVKTRDELRLYVNGIRVGKARARGPVAVSTVNFRVGLGFQEGRFLVNTLGILENTGHHPAADRLMLNLIRYAAGTTQSPLAPQRDDLEEQLQSIGF